MRETERVESRARRDQGPHMRPRVASVPAWKPGRWLAVTSTAALTACWLVAQVRPAQALSSELVESLKASQYVYIASSRKDGSFGKPAEIWFMYHEGAVWVASPPTTWRVRRIRAGRPKARIAVGKLDGATFLATGSIVNDPALHKQLLRSFAEKYPAGWSKWEQRFRDGLADGSRVLVTYQPLE